MEKTTQKKKKDKKVKKDIKVESTQAPKKGKNKSKKLEDIRLQAKKVEKPLIISTAITNQYKITGITNLMKKISLTETEKILLEEKVQYPINRNILDIFKHSKCSLKRDPKLDTSLETEYKEKVKTCKSSLKIFKRRQEIIESIEQNSIVLIHGEPESGATTQVPQFILDEFIKSGNGSLCKIVSTQPYKKNVTVAYKKVSEERNNIFGNSVGVGYQIRFDNHVSRNAASITFCTSGVLMKKISNSWYLNKITHLIIDEIQERDLCTDFLLAFIKQIIPTRTDLKLILICTSVYAKKISKYFDKCPKINVSSELFPVDEYFLEDTLMLINFNDFKFSKQYYEKNKTENKYPKAVTNFVKEYEKSNALNPYLIKSIINFICTKSKEGNVLILLPTAANIRSMESKIETDNSLNSKTQVVNMLDPEENENFNTNRKVFLAYNEKCINLTKNKIMFVIDAAKIRMSFYDIITNRETVKNDWISTKTLKQRTNLAGRYKTGICFHLISEDTIETLDKYPIPQILLCDLEKIILEIKIFGIENAELFLKDCLTPPDKYCVYKTIEMFKNNNILTDEEFLTPLGFHVSKLPLKFSVGKMVILGALFSCLEPILTIAACLDISNIFQGNYSDIQDVNKQYYRHDRCDFLLIIHLLNKYKSSNKSEEDFLKEHFLRPYLFKDINNTIRQLKIRLMDMNFLPKNFDEEKFNINSKKSKLIKALLSIALFPNIALIRNHKSDNFKKITMETISDKPCYIHCTSINYQKAHLPVPILMYKYSTQNKVLNIHDTTFVSPLQVLFFANNIKYSTVNQEECIIKVIGSLKLRCSTSTCEMIKNVQKNFNNWLEYRLRIPVYVNWEEELWDTWILRAVIDLLDIED